MKTRILAALIGCAATTSAIATGLGAPHGTMVAGSGNGAVTTYEQPTPTAMTMGPTVVSPPAATTVATSLASPSAKASPLPAECSMPGMCP